MDSTELLAQLADIHLPEPVGMGPLGTWPPAPGWWVLGLLLLIGLPYLVRWLLGLRTRSKTRKQALAALQHCYQRLASAAAGESEHAQLRYLNEVNEVLRRVALVHFPQTGVAGLSGAAWVDFIRCTGDSSRLTRDIATALSAGRFRPRCTVDADAVQAMAHTWINSLYRQQQRILPSRQKAAPVNSQPPAAARERSSHA